AGTDDIGQWAFRLLPALSMIWAGSQVKSVSLVWLRTQGMLALLSTLFGTVMGGLLFRIPSYSGLAMCAPWLQLAVCPAFFLAGLFIPRMKLLPIHWLRYPI